MSLETLDRPKNTAEASAAAGGPPVVTPPEVDVATPDEQPVPTKDLRFAGTMAKLKELGEIPVPQTETAGGFVGGFPPISPEEPPEKPERPEREEEQVSSKKGSGGFVPTSEWQTVPKGAVLGPDVEVLANQETDEDFARLKPEALTNTPELKKLDAELLQSLKERGIEGKRLDFVNRYIGLHPSDGTKRFEQNVADLSFHYLTATPEERQAMDADLAAAERVKALATNGPATLLRNRGGQGATVNVPQQPNIPTSVDTASAVGSAAETQKAWSPTEFVIELEKSGITGPQLEFAKKITRINTPSSVTGGDYRSYVLGLSKAYAEADPEVRNQLDAEFDRIATDPEAFRRHREEHPEMQFGSKKDATPGSQEAVLTPEKVGDTAPTPQATVEGALTPEKLMRINPENVQRFGKARSEVITKEAKEKGLSQKAVETIEKVGEWYKKQPLWKKVAFSAALFGTTVAGATVGGGAVGTALIAAGVTGSTLQRGLAATSAFVMGKKLSLWLKPNANKGKPERVFDRHTVTGLSAAALVFAMPSIMRQTEIATGVGGVVKEKLSLGGKWLMSHLNVEAAAAAAYEADVSGHPPFGTLKTPPVGSLDLAPDAASKPDLPGVGTLDLGPDLAPKPVIPDAGTLDLDSVAPPKPVVPDAGTLDLGPEAPAPLNLHDGIIDEASKVPMPDGGQEPDFAAAAGVPEHVPDVYAHEVVVPGGGTAWNSIKDSLVPLGLSPEQQQNMTGNVVEYLKAHPELNPDIKDLSKIPAGTPLHLPPPEQMAAWQTHATGLTPAQVANIHNFGNQSPVVEMAPTSPASAVVEAPPAVAQAPDLTHLSATDRANFDSIKSKLPPSLNPADRDGAAWEIFQYQQAHPLQPGVVPDAHGVLQYASASSGVESASAVPVSAGSKDLFVGQYSPKNGFFHLFRDDPMVAWNKVSGMTAQDLLTPNMHASEVGMSQSAFDKLRSDVVRITGGSGHPEFAKLRVADVLQKGSEMGAFSTKV